MVEYTTVQMIHITVAILASVAGLTGYSMGRYLWKKGFINNLNEFLKTLDIGVLVDQISFDPKFVKTMIVAFLISLGVVVLSYSEIIGQIDFNEPLIIVALKFGALGLLAQIGMNTLAKGGTLSSIIQALLTAFAKTETVEEKQDLAIKLINSRNITARRVPTIEEQQQEELNEQNNKIVKPDNGNARPL